MFKRTRYITLFLLACSFLPTLLPAHFAQAGFWEFILPKQLEKVFLTNTTAPPPTPINFAASSGNAQVHLRWDPLLIDNLSHYEISGETITGPLATITVSTPSYTWRDLNNNLAYTFQLAAVNEAGERSDWSQALIITPTAALSTAVQTQGFEIGAWMPTNWDISDARQSFTNNRDLFTYISPFWYDQAGNGALSTKGGARDQSLITAARSQGIKVIPSITNNYSADKITQLLNSSENRNRALTAILTEVTKYNYDGIDLDYENVPPQVKDAYSSFIETLAQKLHAQKKLLHVTLQPKINENYSWSGPGGMDYARIGKVADRVRIMTYDFSRLNTPPGPIAPLNWMQSVIQYAKSQIPSHKILVGIPFYGYDWAMTGASNESSGLVWDGVQNTKNKYTVTEHWDDKSGEPWYEYTSGAGKNIAYYQDNRSVALKVQLAANERVGGVCIWRLGSEDPKNFTALRQHSRTTTSYYIEAPQNLTIQPHDQAVTVRFLPPGGADKITGYSLHYGTDPAKLDQKVDLGKKTEYTLTSLKPEQVYYFVVYARGKNITSPASGMVGGSISEHDFSILQPNLDISTLNNTTVRLTATVGTGSQLPADKIILYGAPGLPTESNLANQIFPWEATVTQSTKEKVQIEVTGLEAGLTYSFMVGGHDLQDKVLPYSNIVIWNEKTQQNIDKPTNLAINRDAGKLVLNWTAVTAETEIIGYDISITEGILNYTPFFVGPRTSLTLPDDFRSDLLFVAVRARAANGAVSPYAVTTYLPLIFN